MSEELVVREQGGAVATQTQHVGRGFEQVDVESVTMPTAKILQPISKEVADSAFEEYNFKPGNIIHSLLLEKLPEAFVPLLLWDDKIVFVPKQEAQKEKLKATVKARHGIELTDDDFKRAWVCRSFDNKTGDKFGNCADCKMCEFNGNEAPFCTKNINALSLFDGQDLPVVVRFSNTSHKHGKAFKNLAYFAGGDLFGRKYKLVAVKKTEKGNTWYEGTVKPAGKTTPEEFAKAEGMYAYFKKMRIDVDEAGSAHEEGAAVQEQEF